MNQNLEYHINELYHKYGSSLNDVKYKEFLEQIKDNNILPNKIDSVNNIPLAKDFSTNINYNDPFYQSSIIMGIDENYASDKQEINNHQANNMFKYLYKQYISSTCNKTMNNNDQEKKVRFSKRVAK